MGIHNLQGLLNEFAPAAVKERPFRFFTGKKVAIDASVMMYQFMTSILAGGQPLKNEEGMITSHLKGMISRVSRLLAHGIKPVFVFDGKPPAMKAGELARRRKLKEEAEKGLADAKEAGDEALIRKFARRTAKVKPEHNQQAMKLLAAMGVPIVQAPGEAEAQCAEMAKCGLVDAVATQDMDALTFGTPVMLRYLTAAEKKGVGVIEITLSVALEQLGLNMQEFMDLCILCGSDYTARIPKVGEKTALKLIKKYRTIEKVLEKMDTKKYVCPADYPYEMARHLFLKPDVMPAASMDPLKWSKPNVEAVVSFLVGEMGFDDEQVRRQMAKLIKAQKKPKQTVIDSFFTVKRKANPRSPPRGRTKKRK
eukprot:gnl/Dysnectes_brevis/2490_a2978_1565.p1 GENE.gnl/Dysnectes_brevis/2490_a2978_1565~~gnl/Dysnectes_brevis/2490_a2978_1565.p1  ORF type:complete len:366 (+),score=129.74 gnl/Dysnectes_brevis/2490_a2978_1565:60-1157(+)